MSSRVQEKEKRRQDRVEREDQLAAEARRKRRLWLAGGAVLVLAVGAAVIAALSSGGGHRTVSLSSGGAANDGAFGTHYDGLVARRQAAAVPTMMDTMNSQAHAHPVLSVFVNGRRITVPVDIGIDPSKDSMEMAGLHTHDLSGTIHVEGMPAARLGQFFQVWGVPFSAGQLGPYRAGGDLAVRMWVDGKPSRAFGQLPLPNGERIVVSYGNRRARPPQT